MLWFGVFKALYFMYSTNNIGLIGFWFLAGRRLESPAIQVERTLDFWNASQAGCTPGGYSTLVLVGMYQWEFKVAPHTYIYQFSKKKWPIHTPIDPILGKILTKITQFFQISLYVSQFLLKFGEFWKSIHSFTKFCIKRESLVYQEADFTSHVCGTSP